ncbi:MAG: class I SAM-dependent methyltransferase [Planctomycetota bacterium]|jgi:SAM-dependent methyltransferase
MTDTAPSESRRRAAPVTALIPVLGILAASCGTDVGESADRTESGPGRARAGSERPVLLLRAADVLSFEKGSGRFLDTIPGPPRFGMDRIIAFEENRYFVYAMGDATEDRRAAGGAPRRDKAPSVARRFLFLKPSTFVVDDRARASDSPRPVRWLLHSSGAADIKGRRIHTTEGDAKLVCETLLPEDAAVKTARPMSNAREPVGHLVEVTPRVDSGAERFVHVLRAGGGGDEVPPARAELARKEGVLELRITAGERTYRLTLPAAGADAGTIAVSEAGGRTLLAQRLLPSGVLPHGPKGIKLLERWDGAYRGGRRPPWDTGRPSSILKDAVEDGTIRPCRAVVLGCGTGTNPVYLAGKGFDVTAIDIAPTALARAEEKARKAGARVRWVLADVLAVPELGAFDFIFDRGCYHGVRRVSATGFVKTVRRLSREGTRFLIVAGNANDTRRGGPPRVKESEIRGDFSKWFDFVWLREARFDSRGGGSNGPLAWSILLRRKPPGP